MAPAPLVAFFVAMQVRLPRIVGIPTTIRGVWSSLPGSLRWLLLSDVFIRTCEALVDVFLVIDVTRIIGLTAPQFGLLVAVQMVTSIMAYFPAAKLADRIGRKSLVIATFVAFAC